MRTVLILVLASSFFVACGSCAGEEGTEMSIQVTSAVFEEGQPIPKKYTCEGPDVSPPLEWTGVPDGAKSLVLICDDPDAPMGTWVHWVLFNLPADTTGLAENVEKKATLENGTRQGVSDFKRPGYGGPCPPPGKPHRYFFKLYALDTMLDLGEGARKKDVEKEMKGRILAQGQLMGTYKR
jgi:Raf kinase inhibitor-like YbhB/YbcL family protein